MYRHLALLALLATAASADRYRIRIGAAPAMFVNDSETYCAQLGTETGGVDPVPEAARKLPKPSVAATPTTSMAAGRDRSASSIQAPTSAADATGQVELDTVTDPPATPPSAEFTAQLSETYGISDPALVTTLWKWYLAEPETLGNAERTGNAVIRQITATGGPLVPSSTARPDLLRPEATTGIVRAGNGVTSRVEPWGRNAGRIEPGTAVTIIPPANGVWYNVVGRGWVCGHWLDLR